MSHLFNFADGASAYKHLRTHLLERGREIGSRSGGTVECEDVTVTIENPRLATTTTRQHFSPALGLVHAAELLLGLDLRSDVLRFAPNYGFYSDWYGVYGPRAAGQLEPLIDELVANPDSRRAVLALWSGDLDMREGLTHTDHPCTIALSFRIRDGRLNATAHMRSNDLWIGFPYDIIQFTVLQMTLANVLDVEVGSYTHHADSFHLYTKDFEKSAPANFSAVLSISGFGHRGCTLEEARLDALAALTNTRGGGESISAVLLNDTIRGKWSAE